MNPIVRALLVVGLASFALAAFASTRIGATAPRFYGTEYPDAPPAPEFALEAHSGGVTGLEELRGRPVLLFFGFTRCPDVCPITLQRLSRLTAELGLDSDRIAIVLVTVDPHHDTVPVLAEYLEAYDGRVLGLRPEPGELAPLLADYGVFAEAMAGHDGGTALAHTDLVFGIDRGGRIRVLLHAASAPEELERDIRTLYRIRA